MNLICKLKRFMKLRHKGVSMKTALREFKHPLTTGDKYALTLIAIIGLVLYLLNARNDFNAQLVSSYQREQNNASYALKLRNELHKTEQVIASFLNGTVTINGRNRTVCIYNYAGECEKP